MTLKTDRNFARRKEGMSLLEIVIVIALISILMAFIVNRLSGVSERQQAKMVALAVESGFEMPLKEFQIDMRRYPTTAEGMKALIERPENDKGRWRGPYLESEEMITDLWGNKYEYRYPGTQNKGKYDLYSLGPDGVESEDDLKNW